MFNLKQSIVEWRKQMLAAGIKTPALEELEGHLREEIERQTRLKLSEQRAFELAVREIGDTQRIKMEFMKMENRNRPLMWAAWGLFVTSFFLTAVNDTKGWECAWLSASVPKWDWQGFSHGDPGAIWMESLTFANLLIVISPLFLAWPKIDSSKWLRWLSWGAGILVWSYIIGLMAHGAFHQLKSGCYAWGLSFLLLGLSTLTIRSPKKLETKYV